MSPINYFESLDETVRMAIAEDVGSGDITAQLVPRAQIASAQVITREAAIVCGRPWVDEVFKQIDSELRINWLVEEGDAVKSGQVLFMVDGYAQSILTAERTALNFLQTLMATATISCTYADLLKDSETKILDTRKTIPGLRLAQKYAVKVGGGMNHRMGLYDAFLIKENHIVACGGILNAVTKAHQIAPGKPVEVEVENLAELEQAIRAGADIIMLDNFTANMIKEAIALKKHPVKYELSGNLKESDLKIGSYKHIDYISSGALTKNIDSVDLSMRIEALGN